MGAQLQGDQEELVAVWRPRWSGLPRAGSDEGVARPAFLNLGLTENGAGIVLSVYSVEWTFEDLGRLGSLTLTIEEAERLARGVLARRLSGNDLRGAVPGQGVFGLRCGPR